MNRNLKLIKLNTLLVLSLFFCVLGCEKSTLQKTTWYKGNLHTHSYWSDGDEFPEMIMDWYKSNDYQFVALSDHNILAQDDYWIEIPTQEKHQKAFENYLSKYSKDSSVVYTRVSDTLKVKLKTFEEYRPLFEEEDQFLIIQSEEITGHFEKKPIHMNVTNVQELIDPRGGASVSEVIQNNIDAVHQQRTETGIPMIAHINHPNFWYGISLEDMKWLKGNRFFEVFNGHPHVKNNGDENHHSTEEMWDLLNITYLNNGQELLYGISTDDSHHYHEIAEKWSNAGRGWIEVNASELSAESLIDAMENGQFYASTGVALNELIFDDNELRLSIKPQPNTTYKIEFIGCNKNEDETRVLQEVIGTEASFKLDEELLFVRAKITADKPPLRPMKEMKFQKAWTQPVLYKK